MSTLKQARAHQLTHCISRLIPSESTQWDECYVVTNGGSAKCDTVKDCAEFVLRRYKYVIMYSFMCFCHLICFT